MKAQAIAARTYIVRNLGQFENENFDICATDFCQVYRGLGTEHPLSDEAVEQTRGMIATFEGEAINALYSSTCGRPDRERGKCFLSESALSCFHDLPLSSSGATAFRDVDDVWQLGRRTAGYCRGRELFRCGPIPGHSRSRRAHFHGPGSSRPLHPYEFLSKGGGPIRPGFPPGAGGVVVRGPRANPGGSAPSDRKKERFRMAGGPSHVLGR